MADKTDAELYREWLATRPPIIQEMARKWPMGEYIMSPEAPYGISCPGTLVILEGYSENGEVIVLVTPQNIRPEAIAHSNSLLHPQGRDHSEIADSTIQCRVDPKYLLPHKVYYEQENPVRD